MFELTSWSAPLLRIAKLVARLRIIEEAERFLVQRRKEGECCHVRTDGSSDEVREVFSAALADLFQ